MLPMLARGSGTPMPDWWAHQKIDGHRRAVTITADGTVQGWSRRGTPANLPGPVVADLRHLANGGLDITLDGELLDGTLWLFDMPRLGGAINGRSPLYDRLPALDELHRVWQPDNVHVLPVARTPEQIARLAVKVADQHGEGIIHKDPRGRYVEGKRSPSWIKHKFVDDIDVIVTRFDVDGKTNCELAVYDENAATAMGITEFPESLTGHDDLVANLVTAGVLVPVGEVSRLTGHGPKVQIGDVVSVTILYVTDSNRLYQPVTPKIRDDKAPNECSIDQLDSLRPNRTPIDSIA